MIDPYNYDQVADLGLLIGRPSKVAYSAYDNFLEDVNYAKRIYAQFGPQGFPAGSAYTAAIEYLAGYQASPITGFDTQQQEIQFHQSGVEAPMAGMVSPEPSGPANVIQSSTKTLLGGNSMGPFLVIGGVAVIVLLVMRGR